MPSDLHYGIDVLLTIRLDVDGVVHEKVMKVNRLTPRQMGVFSSPGGKAP